MNTTECDQVIVKLNAETLRLIDETSKINSRNVYAQMAVSSLVTLGVVVILCLII